jgi:DNA polymerase-3 subunit alpha
MSGFTHLHLHSQYSLLDGAIRLDQLFPRLNELKMEAVALTDHGNMFGVIDFYTRAKKAGIKPIVGCETYVAGAKGMFDRTSRDVFHLVLLAKNEIGYQNLCQLISRAYIDGFYYHPRVDKALLARYSEGLIATSACLSGELPKLIRYSDMDEVCKTAREYADIFGPDNFFLELQQNGLAEQQVVNQALLEVAEKEKLPLVATNDCHYLNKGDHHAHDILLCISTGKMVDDPNRMRHDTTDLYLRTAEEMQEMFKDTPQALENTARIAESCNLELELGKNFLPQYQVPKEYQNLEDYLRARAEEGLEKHLKTIDPSQHQRYRERLDYELGVINNMGFPGYFLIVWDFIHYAKSEGIPVGPGRGSGAGSLVAFSLGITSIDPLPYDLIFERFLNPERVSMPDFDIDFCQDRRGEVISYVSEKYGVDRVGQIITFGQLKARIAIKDVGRVLGLTFAETDKVSKLVPMGPKVTLDSALKEEPRLQEIQDEKSVYRELIQVARSLEGLNRHSGIHAAGVVIAEKPLVEHVPVIKGDDGVLITQYAKDEVEMAGLVKFDFLGLKTLTVIEHAIQLIAQSGVELDIDSIPLDDPKVFELLISGETDGVFQVESDGFKQLMKELKPDRFEDIIAAVALYRPGPLGAGMVDDYIDRKHGRKPVEYPHPVVEPTLESTYGVIIYQEQVMRIAVDLCGFTMGNADVLRKAMGKKKIEEMMRLKKLFVEGAQTGNGMPQADATELFEKIERFAEYAFNKSHSAAYAMISYQTAYLKAHHPVEFMAALLSSEMNDTDKLIKHIVKIREMEIEILAPDVNRSEKKFSVDSGKILFGLGAVKGVGDAAIDAICEARKEKPYSSLFDFCSRSDLRKINKRLVEAAIKSGAMDSFGASRAAMCASIEMAFSRAQAEQKERQSGQCNLLELMAEKSQDASAINEPPLPDMAEWSEQDLLTQEREALGFCISGHPLDRYKRVMGRVVTSSTQSLAQAGRQEVTLAALVATMRERPLKNGSGRMAILTLEDLEGTCEALAFSKEFAEFEQVLKSNEPLLVTGNVMIEGDENPIAKLRVQKVGLLSEVRKQKTSNVHFRLTAEQMSEERLLQLKSILSRFRGKCQGYMHIELTDIGSETVLKLPQAIASSEKMEHEVNSLFRKNVCDFS